LQQHFEQSLGVLGRPWAQLAREVAGMQPTTGLPGASRDRVQPRGGHFRSRRPEVQLYGPRAVERHSRCQRDGQRRIRATGHPRL
jgi:hypothetical protein